MQLSEIITLEEREEMFRSIREAAVGLALFWDQMRVLENKYNVELNPDAEFISMIAGDVNFAEMDYDLDEVEVFSHFDEVCGELPMPETEVVVG